MPDLFSRRDFLRCTSAAMALGQSAARLRAADSLPTQPKPVAAVITQYFRGSHADVLLGKILEGWRYDGGTRPALKLEAMYVDQFPAADMARSMAEKHGVALVATIEEALTLGRDRVSVDGVISIGEHGNYPVNDKGQTLYPRKRFFEEITATFEKYQRVVPVFSDKHLGPAWEDALWMYTRARDLQVPFMAGSSLPVGFRDPELEIPLDSEIEGAVGIGYSGLDIYGAHALDCFQSLVERRRNAEGGVEWVQAFRGDEIWRQVDSGVIRADLLKAALAATPHAAGADPRKSGNASLFQFRYTDGFLGHILMLPEFAGGNSLALKLQGETKPVATRFEERTEPHYPHFAYLLKAIERMIHTGRPSYPVERTLLSSGILDRALTSLAEGQRRIETPELKIRYRPVAYPHAPRPDLESPPND